MNKVEVHGFKKLYNKLIVFPLNVLEVITRFFYKWEKYLQMILCSGCLCYDTCLYYRLLIKGQPLR